MSQIVASKPFCLENSTQLTRPASETFYRIDGSNGPNVIDKHQAKRLYRLQRTPMRQTSLRIDQTEPHYDAHGYFNSIVEKQIQESSPEQTKSIYHAPTDMSNQSLTRFSLGKARLDPQYLVPNETHSVRSHPIAITMLRHEQMPDGEVVPNYRDRLVVDRVLRGRLGPGGTLNPEEDCRQAENYLRTHGRLSTSAPLVYIPRTNGKTAVDIEKRDALARQFMYTSSQQASFNEVPWDSKLPKKLPVPPSTFEILGSDPVLKTEHAASLLDGRTREVLDHDHAQMRQTNFYRKPIQNVAPLPRAQHISGYSGCIGGERIHDIDDPTVDFKPLTVLRTEQPKFGQNPYKPNIPFYTGKTYWTKTDAVSHIDKSGRPFTTTAAFHKPLPLPNESVRHSELNGELSRAVTTVVPQNPFNQVHNSVPTTNASLDYLSRFTIQSLPKNSGDAEKSTQ